MKRNLVRIDEPLHHTNVANLLEAEVDTGSEEDEDEADAEGG